jgi:hypothetical protein
VNRPHPYGEASMVIKGLSACNWYGRCPHVPCRCRRIPTFADSPRCGPGVALCSPPVRCPRKTIRKYIEQQSTSALAPWHPPCNDRSMSGCPCVDRGVGYILWEQLQNCSSKSCGNTAFKKENDPAGRYEKPRSNGKTPLWYRNP